MIAIEDRKYCTYPSDQLDSIDFDCFLTTRGSLAYSEDKSEVILVYAGNKPKCIYGHPVFTNTQMKAKHKDVNDTWYQNPDIEYGD